MKVFAPGKLVLTGAYVVLRGAPAIVLATTRGAVADSTRTELRATPEVRAALGDEPAPHVDASALFVGDRKLGLGASAAILVASLGAREAARGVDLASDAARRALFTRALAAHAAAQGGGSGVDVAASLHGGTLRYVMGQPPERISLPPETRIATFACGTSARTSALRADIDRLATTSPALHASCMDELTRIAQDAAAAAGRADHAAFVTAIGRAARALDRLGEAAGAGLVPRGFDVLEAAAAEEGASFCVSGAGGGDVAVFVGSAPPSKAFVQRAHAHGLFLLDVNLDEKGVRVVPAAPAFAGASAGDTPAR